jgi:hypothetical protein
MLKLKREFNLKIDNFYYQHDPTIKRYAIQPIRQRPNIYAQPKIFGFYLNIPKTEEVKIYNINSNMTLIKDWK